MSRVARLVKRAASLVALALAGPFLFPQLVPRIEPEYAGDIGFEG